MRLDRKRSQASKGVVRDRFDIIPPAASNSRNPMKKLQLAGFIVSLTAGGILAQSSKSTSGDGEWPMYNRDLAGTRYSPLKQITTGNVSKLVRAWSYLLGRDQTAGTLSGGSEFT